MAVRQTADILRRFGALDDSDFQKVQALGRDESLLSVLRIWYRAGLTVTSPLGYPGADDDGKRAGERCG